MKKKSFILNSLTAKTPACTHIVHVSMNSLSQGTDKLPRIALAFHHHKTACVCLCMKLRYIGR